MIRGCYFYERTSEADGNELTHRHSMLAATHTHIHSPTRGNVSDRNCLLRTETEM